MGKKPANPAHYRDRREAVFYLLFESLFSDSSPAEIVEIAKTAENFTFDETAIKTFTAICEKSAELDALTAEFSQKRVLERLPKVSIAILRIAFYEILYDKKMHENFAVSEAVRLATDFAYEADIKFINGVLGNYLRSKKNTETPEAETETALPETEIQTETETANTPEANS
jgi:N utilization substance protein B